MFLDKVYPKYQQYIEEIVVFECENQKFYKIPRSARSHIHISALIVLCMQMYFET